MSRSNVAKDGGQYLSATREQLARVGAGSSLDAAGVSGVVSRTDGARPPSRNTGWLEVGTLLLASSACQALAGYGAQPMLRGHGTSGAAGQENPSISGTGAVSEHGALGGKSAGGGSSPSGASGAGASAVSVGGSADAVPDASARAGAAGEDAASEPMGGAGAAGSSAQTTASGGTGGSVVALPDPSVHFAGVVGASGASSEGGAAGSFDSPLIGAVAGVAGVREHPATGGSATAEAAGSAGQAAGGAAEAAGSAGQGGGGAAGAGAGSMGGSASADACGPVQQLVACAEEAGAAGGGTEPEPISCTVDVTARWYDCAGTGPIKVMALDQGLGKVSVDLDGYRQLEIRVTVSNPTGYVLDVGDSSSCNGGGGDAGQTPYDAEVDVVDRGYGFPLILYPNDFDTREMACKRVVLEEDYFALEGTTVRSLFVSDGKVRWGSGGCWEADTYFRIHAVEPYPSDSTLYVGLNRVILDDAVSYGSGPRVGTGLQQATFILR